MSNSNLTFPEELILLELALGKADAAKTLCELRDCATRQAGDGAKAGLGPALARLAGQGLIEELPRAPRQRSSRWRIRTTGHEALREALGALPARKGAGWRQKAARALAARRFLKLPPRVAAALAEQGALPLYFLAARLGEAFQPGMTLDSLARRTAAAALGLSNDQPETLWRALVQRALSAETAEPHPEDAPLPFREQIDRAADSARDGWFGPRKLFIHRAWEAWKATSGETAGLPEFKSRLLESLRAGDLALARADFTAGIDAADLEQAEMKYGNEEFHFINFPYDKHP